jgi:hypothetical protein
MFELESDNEECCTNYSQRRLCSHEKCKFCDDVLDMPNPHPEFYLYACLKEKIFVRFERGFEGSDRDRLTNVK